MKESEFEGFVEKLLGKLNGEQLVEFAWRLGVLSLPVIAVYGKLDFWRGESQRFLLEIFKHLDVTKDYSILVGESKGFALSDHSFGSLVEAKEVAMNCKADKVVAAIEVIANMARVVPRRITKCPKCKTSYAIQNLHLTAAKGSVRCGSCLNVFDAKENFVDADPVRYDHVKTALSRASDAAHSIYKNILEERNRKAFKSLLVKEVESITQGASSSFSSLILAKRWPKFRGLLDYEGCGYWVDYFEEILRNEFKYNEKLRGQLRFHLGVPASISENGAAAASKYIEGLLVSSTQINEARLIVLGDKGSGKTSITRRLLDPNSDMPKDAESTAGVDTHIWDKEGCTIRIWDFAGHTVTHAVHKFFLSERCVYLIVHDGRTDSVGRLEFWLEQKRIYGGDSDVIVLVNKKDEHSPKIPLNRLTEKYSIVCFSEFSVKNDHKELLGFREHVFNTVQQNLSWARKSIPESYYLVKKELENLFSSADDSSKKEFISIEEFKSIAEGQRINESDSLNGLLANLHALGVSLWYPRISGVDTLVLNPEWVSHGVYQIINWASNNERYSVDIDEFKKIFEKNLDRYPERQHRFIFELLNYYELSYSNEGNCSIVIPHLLKEDQPGRLPVFEFGDALMLRYQAQQDLPGDVITRFIVRYHHFIRQADEVWRLGVVLENANGDVALVREDDRILEVRVKGRTKTEFLTQLRNSINEIFSDYKSERPEIEYRVYCEEYCTGRSGEFDDKSIWLTENKIAVHAGEGRPYYDDISRTELELNDQARNYNIKIVAEDGANLFMSEHQCNSFNIDSVNYGLQGSLTELAELLHFNGNPEEASDVKSAQLALEKIEGESDRKKILKSGKLNYVDRLLRELSDEGSRLNTAVKGLKRGGDIVQDVARHYHKIAEWVGSI